MNKKLLTISFLVLSSFLLGSSQNVLAGSIYIRGGVEFDSQSQQVGGFVATYVTYDIYDYYDPGAHGILYYANPTEQIDQDGGFGVNSYLYAYYPGYKADFTTNDYRPNRILCTFGEHGLLKLYTPTPLSWSDPYQMDSITPQYYSGDYDMSIPSYDPAAENTYVMVKKNKRQNSPSLLHF